MLGKPVCQQGGLFGLPDLSPRTDKSGTRKSGCCLDNLGHVDTVGKICALIGPNSQAEVRLWKRERSAPDFGRWRHGNHFCEWIYVQDCGKRISFPLRCGSSKRLDAIVRIGQRSPESLQAWGPTEWTPRLGCRQLVEGHRSQRRHRNSGRENRKSTGNGLASVDIRPSLFSSHSTKVSIPCHAATTSKKF